MSEVKDKTLENIQQGMVSTFEKIPTLVVNIPSVVFEKLPNPGAAVWNPMLPTVAHSGDAGMDFYAATNVAWEILPETNEVGSFMVGSASIYIAIVPTGLIMKLPTNKHMRIASRSGLGFKSNILAFPGTIDNSYRGEIRIKLFALGTPDVQITAGTKIAQGVLFQGYNYEIAEGIVSGDTARGTSGFGSTDANL